MTQADQETRSLQTIAPQHGLPRFRTTRHSERGRLGELALLRAGVPLPPQATPLLFPVVCFMTGTTPRGGGLWRYLLQGNRAHGLLRRDLPLMSQVLHFLDFHVNPNAVANWRKGPLRRRYNEAHDGLNYQAPLFLDSGGFKLLFNSQLDLSAYGLPPDERLPERILELQRDLGGDLIATLDYPLPPNLERSEAEERMARSRRNAVAAAKGLRQMAGYTPFLYVAVHGQTGEDIRRYVGQVFRERQENGLAGIPFGIAIGSLVPLRGGGKYEQIVEIVRGAIAGVPEEHRSSTPVHVFGISGTMIPLLVYLGVDTFDSSTYVQNARRLAYADPVTHRRSPVLEMNGVDCDCRICRELDFDDMHRTLTQGRSWRPRAGDKFKSEYYAAIALHNLEMDLRIVEQAREAVEADAMVDFIIECAEGFADLAGALERLAAEDEVLRPRLRRVTIAVHRVHEAPIVSPYQPSLFAGEQGTVSLRFTPDSFRIPRDYVPPAGKKALLIIPCSGDKPYAASRTHAFLMARLRERFGMGADAVHKVTLSGLYGPVPEEFEREEAVLQYEFRLVSQNKSQIALCTQRTTHYLRRYGPCYDGVFGYATSLAYRSVLEKAAYRYKDLRLYPTQPKQRRLTEFFRNANVEELLEALAALLEDDEHDGRTCSRGTVADLAGS
jgi:7-cyano-7-deazaguanine tRNA-ribosyltransferase